VGDDLAGEKLLMSAAPPSARADQRALSQLISEGSMSETMFTSAGRESDLVCLTHLRWSWVYQRPQHLMTRAARDRRVFVFEEPVFGADRPWTEVTHPAPNVTVGTPHLPDATGPAERTAMLRHLLDTWLGQEGARKFVLWYYTPMALPFSVHLEPEGIVYDCMDELSAFAGAPPELPGLERQLMSRSDIVFTGGYSIFESKRRHHSQIHAVPSSVDFEHFVQARDRDEPDDQASLPGPRLGYCGVIDERLDIDLITAVATARPNWQLIFLGPVTKIDPEVLPRHSNIHYLGGRDYRELPRYLSGWDVALLPFAHNESTRFISPTKTPEYLAAGRRVVSTSVPDVVRTFGTSGFVEIADAPADFMAAIERCLTDDHPERQARVDRYLAMQSWDRTWARMQALMSRALTAGTAYARPMHVAPTLPPATRAGGSRMPAR
jgi:UDP-galactopyranose mutase